MSSEFSAGIRGGAVARLLCAVALLLATIPTHAGSAEYDLKAAFIYQIAKFVEWPPSRGGSVRLCVIGGNPFGAALETIRGKPLNERKMEVALLDPGADLRECAMLFIATPAERHLDRIVAISRGSGMLTIGDTEGFAQRGAMVNFYVENGKVRFEINLDIARQADLRISSKLLSLARIVDSQPAR